MEGVRLTTAFNGTACAPFVIPSVPGFPTSPLSLATTYVVLSKENHTQLTEAATLDRKSGEAEGSAVRHSCAPPLPAHNLSFVILPAPACRGSEALRRSIRNRELCSAESKSLSRAWKAPAMLVGRCS